MSRAGYTQIDPDERSVWTKAVGGDLKAIDRCLAIMGRRAKLLGLDMPTNREITVISHDASPWHC